MVRKSTVLVFVVAVCLVALSGSALGASRLRLGLQASGTFSWVVYAIQKYGLDAAHGIELETMTVATKAAAEIAIRSGEVDVLVDDIIGVTLMRRQNLPVRAIYPYSLAVGSLVVPVDSDVQSIADIKGKRVGVASLDDKSWLILRAAAVKNHGFDPQDESEVLAAAPPLLSELLGRGELDAALPYWHFVARMVASGEYRVVTSVAEMLESLGLPSELPILVLVARDAAIEENRQAIEGFLGAVHDAWERMMEDEAFWNDLVDQGLYALPDRSLLPSVQRAFADGVPSGWSDETVQSLSDLVEQLVAVAGAEIVGADSIDPDTFTTDLRPR